MPLTDGVRLRLAAAADLPHIAELREEVGWSVHEWALRAVLQPPNARCIVAVDDRERVVGVGSGIAYGRLGFVGNMVVAPTHRRRGLGSAILEAVTAFLEERGVVRMELYATGEGRPLYARAGFRLTNPSAMVRMPRVTEAPPPGFELTTARPADGAELAAFDAPRFGGDRSAVLQLMLRDTERPLLAARRDARIVGFAWLRPDDERVGPLLADTPEVAAALLGEAFEHLPAADALTLNLPAGNRAGAARLAELGADLEPWDGRMSRGPQVPRQEATVYANVVGALG